MKKYNIIRFISIFSVITLGYLFLKYFFILLYIIIFWILISLIIYFWDKALIKRKKEFEDISKIIETKKIEYNRSKKNILKNDKIGKIFDSILKEYNLLRINLLKYEFPVTYKEILIETINELQENAFNISINYIELEISYGEIRAKKQLDDLLLKLKNISEVLIDTNNDFLELYSDLEEFDINASKYLLENITKYTFSI